MLKLLKLNPVLLLVVLIGIIGYHIVSCNQSTQHSFRTVIVWHASTVQSFAAQKDFILRGIIELQTDYSEIFVIPVSASDNETLKIIKTDKDWIRDFADLRFNNGNAIPNTVVKDALRMYLNHNTTTKIAEILYFVVDDASEIDDVIKVEDELKRKKVFVICTTNLGISKIWESLATDKNHLFKLTGNKDDVVVEKELIRLSYSDSRLPCDTNLYWDDIRCMECTNMCSMITKSVPPACERDCPYLDRTPANLPTTIKQEDVETVISDEKGFIICVTLISIVIVAGLICFVLWLYWRGSCNQFWQRRCCWRPRDVETALAERDTTAVTETGHTEAGNDVQNNDDDSTEEPVEGHEGIPLLDYTRQPREVDDATSSAANEDSSRESDASEPSGLVENLSVEPFETVVESEPLKTAIFLDFSSVAELDANGHTFSGEPFQNLHSETSNVEATYVKEQSSV